MLAGSDFAALRRQAIHEIGPDAKPAVFEVIFRREGFDSRFDRIPAIKPVLAELVGKLLRACGAKGVADFVVAFTGPVIRS